MSDYTRLDVRTDNGIAHVRLNCPEELNRMSKAFWRELPGAIREIDRAAEARVIVISSTGRHFSAGLDLAMASELRSSGSKDPGRLAADFRDRILEFQAAFTAIEEVRQPVIAAIQGGCIGGGVGLASACDMRYCSEDAFFSIEETNIGITCDVGSLQRLPHQISETNLREWAYSGRRVDAQTALRWGLVGAVHADQGSMLEAVLELAREIAGKSPLVLSGLKQTMNYAREHSIAEGLQQVALWNAAILQPSEVMLAVARRGGSEQAFESLLPRRSPFEPG